MRDFNRFVCILYTRVPREVCFYKWFSFYLWFYSKLSLNTENFNQNKNNKLHVSAKWIMALWYEIGNTISMNIFLEGVELGLSSSYWRNMLFVQRNIITHWKKEKNNNEKSMFCFQNSILVFISFLWLT